jgi:FkbM family methyltransferase
MVDFMGILSSLEKLFTSRKLFSNWLLAGIMYYLIERGFIKGDIVVKCGGKRYKLDPRIYSFIVSYYHDGFLKSVSCDGNLTGRLGGLLTLVINSKGLVLLKTPDDILLVARAFDPTVLVETYLYDIHFLGFDLTDWLIVDVGAYIGDTPLYYAKRGAFVVAVEPLPSNYEVMLRNLELNPDLKHRVVPVNAAISGRDGFVEFSYSKPMDGGASIYGGGMFKVKVRSMRLSTLIKEITSMGLDLDRFKVRVLKMDCKGCEYDVINEVDVLRLFDIVKIEYSGYLRGKTYHELKGVLENLGFTCRVWAHNEFAPRVGLDKHGMITCAKNPSMLLR